MTFERGKFEDWEVVCVDSTTYAIYRKDYNQEWQDKQGDNLVFEAEGEAVAYLKEAFGQEDNNVSKD